MIPSVGIVFIVVFAIIFIACGILNREIEILKDKTFNLKDNHKWNFTNIQTNSREIYNTNLELSKLKTTAMFDYLKINTELQRLRDINELLLEHLNLELNSGKTQLIKKEK